MSVTESDVLSSDWAPACAFTIRKDTVSTINEECISIKKYRHSFLHTLKYAFL